MYMFLTYSLEDAAHSLDQLIGVYRRGRTSNYMVQYLYDNRESTWQLAFFSFFFVGAKW